MITRTESLHSIEQFLEIFPVVILTGPRQCGKTTLAKQILSKRKSPGHFFDLEDPDTALKPEIAKIVLEDLEGLIVIDEFQRQPALFELIRVLADRQPTKAQFLILGSASPSIVKGASESLAGRAGFIELSGFTLEETAYQNPKQLWIRGGFPKSYLAETDATSFIWRDAFITSFLERDIPQLGIHIPQATLRRFWRMVAHFHGRLWNAADFARALNAKEDTARHYLDILTGAFMLRQLQPWFENVGKRLVKSPKIYLSDTGILHTLLGLKSLEDVLSYPNFGFSWEGFAIDQVIRICNVQKEAYFYQTQSGAELDLLIVKGNKRYGFEFKFADAPSATKSMHTVIEDLNLEKLWVVYPGKKRYPLFDKIELISLEFITPELMD